MSEYADRAIGFEKGQAATTRPDGVTDEHLEFLDELRSSGRTNMFGARPYLMSAFPELDDEAAATALSYWMKTFGKDGR